MRERIAMRKYGIAGMFSYSLVATIIVACAKPYHEETERYVFVATNIICRTGRKRRLVFWTRPRALGVKAE